MVRVIRFINNGDRVKNKTRGNDEGGKQSGNDGQAKKTADNKKKTVYVTSIVSDFAIFRVLAKPKESKFSYGVPIRPYAGVYRVRIGKKYANLRADELANYNVVLNVDKSNSKILDALTPGKVVVKGVTEDDVVIVADRGVSNG